MIHVNVKQSGPTKMAGQSLHPFIVETSTDGGGWKTQYVIEHQTWESTDDHRRRAEEVARIMGVAWSYAGIEWRGTSCGYSLTSI